MKPRLSTPSPAAASPGSADHPEPPRPYPDGQPRYARRAVRAIKWHISPGRPANALPTSTPRRRTDAAEVRDAAEKGCNEVALHAGRAGKSRHPPQRITGLPPLARPSPRPQAKTPPCPLRFAQCHDRRRPQGLPRSSAISVKSRTCRFRSRGRPTQVSAASRRAEQTLYAEPCKGAPATAFVGEEGDASAKATTKRTARIVDPLDGATTELPGIPAVRDLSRTGAFRRHPSRALSAIRSPKS